MLAYVLPATYMGSMLQHELVSAAQGDDTPWTSGLSLLADVGPRPAVATSFAQLQTLTKIPCTKSSNFQVCPGSACCDFGPPARRQGGFGSTC